MQDEPSTDIQTVEENTTGNPEMYYGISKFRRHRGKPRPNKLQIMVTATASDGTSRDILALVDTGAQVNLINPRVLDPGLFVPATKPVRLGSANSHPLPGGGEGDNADPDLPGGGIGHPKTTKSQPPGDSI
jgi:hypothetical protein